MKRLIISKLIGAIIITGFFVLVIVTMQEKLKDSAIVKHGFFTYHQCNQLSKKLVFMKTHKCASSTVQNILFRHALREDLNLAIPEVGNYLSRTGLFNRSVILNAPWGAGPVDLFTLHNRWNFNETVALMGESVFTFTIVRSPVDQFESLFIYMKLEDTYGVNLKSFISMLQNGGNTTDTSKRGSNGQFGRNQIAFDLGIDPTEFEMEMVFEERIKNLEKEFKFVMIAERMEESLVLLADLLCWPLEYVRFLELNVRKPEMTVTLTQEERNTLENWLNLDTALYQYFARRFEERITEVNSYYGPLWLKEKIETLRQLNNNLKSQCVIEQVGNEKLNGKFHETSNSIMGYLVKNDSECEQYAMSEPAYLNLFRTRMAIKYTLA